ncbi:MAG: hypothetical protein ACE5IZ_09075 [Dehalococcoidia bacterium]
MDRKTAAKVAGLTAWHRDREGMLENARKGGEATRQRHGKQHYVRMRARRTELAQRRREPKEAAV